jgi:hypothetical protein
LPHPRGKTLQLLELPDRSAGMELSAVLRLANALDVRSGHDGTQHRGAQSKARRVEVHAEDHFVVVRVEGYSALDRSAEEIAAARHLLETVLRRPVLVRGLRVATRSKVPSRNLLAERL